MQYRYFRLYGTVFDNTTYIMKKLMDYIQFVKGIDLLVIIVVNT